MGKALIVENVGKMYRLGTVGTGTLSHDLNRFWHKIRGKEDPYTKVGQENNRATASDNPYVWALKDINFSVDKGEVLGIIGKNGAGKSTLLKILSKITSPTTGCIKVNGRIASLLEVGTGFHPELTGRENIYLNGAILGMKRHEIKAKFDEIVEFSGCERYLDTPVKRYSSGMYVRLAFAVAAHLESEILIVDEVLAVGDAEFQKKCLGKMHDVSKDGKSVIFVSHDMNAIYKLCPNSILMQNGKIELLERTDIAIKKYFEYMAKNSITDVKRVGNGKVRVEEIAMTDGNSNFQNVYQSGNSIFIEMKVKAYDDIPILHYAVTIKNMIGSPVTSAWTLFEDNPQKIKKGEEKYIKFELKNLRLVPGEYTVLTYINYGNEVFEMIDQATSFSIIQPNNITTTYPSSSEGIFASDAVITIK